MNCLFCNKICKNENSLRNHQRLCKENPDRQLLHESAAWKKAISNKKKSASNQYIKAEKLGVPKPIMSEETRKKLSDAGKKQVWDKEKRKKHSLIMSNAVKRNPDSYTKNNVCGRVKLYEYNGIKLKGKWELRTAQWLDENKVKWENESNPQPYYWNDNWHLYFPDFYIPDHNLYIEVKGYKTVRDDAKWSQFKEKLVIIDSNIMKILNDITFEELCL
jgi:hypothetical protein